MRKWALSLFFLNIADALFTQYHVGHLGAAELNPLVDSFMTVYPDAWILLKVLWVNICLATLMVAYNKSLKDLRAYLVKALVFTTGFYALLVIYHITLFILIFEF